MMFERIRCHFRRNRIARQQSTVAAHSTFLSDVYERRFPGTDKARFELLWCEVAEICGVAPDTLHEDDTVANRCPPPKGWLSSDTRLDDLEYIIVTESRGRPPWKRRPETIGEILDYLLERDPSDPGD